MSDLILTTKAELETMIFNTVRKALAEGQSVKSNSSNENLPINIDEAVRITGLAKATIYSKFSRREIPGYRRGQKLYFYKSELLEWINSGRRSTNGELAEIKANVANNIGQ